jgi:hypothetical protein
LVPAFEAVGGEVNEMVTSFVLGVQAPLEVVQRRTYDVPDVPLKTEVGLDVVTIVPPVPLMMLHAPVPIVGVLAASDVVVAHNA